MWGSIIYGALALEFSAFSSWCFFTHRPASGIGTALCALFCTFACICMAYAAGKKKSTT
jgi:hypothetical protein